MRRIAFLILKGIHQGMRQIWKPKTFLWKLKMKGNWMPEAPNLGKFEIKI
jgi:hypothetical protein